MPDEGGEPREYSLPRGVHVNVQEGTGSARASRGERNGASGEALAE